ncbi:helix-turn-helix domain-containing protein [Mariniflexile sp. AS56]|uniref:helix-turn-helix domain-containing protein n=1 Tax=Mariniflexile sp. AS56 TaxID=3063957 RepID=UPI0026EAE850|nr:AraC family transcriptional regulator [Mariniflexile sp. AS56]MDO7174138.1 AraC family transcriptional regulator [Mariniflexile sp. AS56]
MIESFLFLFTGIIGLVTITIMITSYRSNPFYNAFLLLIISIVSLRFLVHGSFEMGLQHQISPDQGPQSLFFLVVIPAFYLYYKNLVLQNKTYDVKDLKHLIFIVLLFICNTHSFITDSFIFAHRRIINLTLVAGFILFYLGRIAKFLSKNIWFKKGLLINNTQFRLVKNWTICLFTQNFLATITLLISIYTEVSAKSNLSGKSLGVLLLLYWLFIYFKILTAPEILYGLPILNKKILKFNLPEEDHSQPEILKNENWILDVNDTKNDPDLKLQEKIMSNIVSYIQEIDRLSVDEFIFRNPKAAPADIANKLGVPTSHIVYLFKYHSSSTFSEYRMHSRIKDSIHLIEQDYLKTNTLESLAYKTGFASYNPFFSAFKKVTNHSPQDYLKSTKQYS